MTDQNLTEQIWREMGVKIKGFIQSRVNDPQVAEDLVQETFVRIHQKIGGVDDLQRLKSWVFQIARNLVVDHYRANAREPAFRDVPGSADDLSNPKVENDNINDLVMGWLPAMIDQLPESSRDAVRLYELEGLPQQDIAERLQLSLSGAKSRIQRGREKLKELLFDCCSFEVDRRGNVIDYRRNEECDDCGNGT